MSLELKWSIWIKASNKNPELFYFVHYCFRLFYYVSMISILLCENTCVHLSPSLWFCAFVLLFVVIFVLLVSCILDVASVAGLSIWFSLMVIYESRCVSYSLLFFFGDTLTSHDILYGVTSGFILATDKSSMNLLNINISIPGKQQEMFSDWYIYFTVL